MVSAEDCRLRSNTLRLRLIMQNVANEPLRVLYNKLCISLVDGGGLQIRRAKRGDMCATGVEWAVDRVKGHVNHSRYEVDVLQMYDFAILTLDVVLPDVVFEVDALERLKEIRVPCLIEAASHHTVVVATFVEKEIWDAYSLVPGGWWVRS